MEFITLPEVIRQYVHLDRPNSLGWHPVLCKVCNDRGKKGKRAGFKFEGDVTAYNCFNCAHAAVFDPSEHQTMPKNMLDVLHAFDIPDIDWQPVLFQALANASTSQGPKDPKPQISIEPAEIPLPNFFHPLTDDKNNEWCQYAIEYLRDERGINWKNYPFMVTSKSSHPDNKRWYGRLIIPIYKNNKLIFYQGRDLTDLHIKKYLSPTVPRDNILFGFDQLVANTSDPLYITEGFFDSFLLKGVAVFSNKITSNQIKWINQSHRPKVVIPDRFGDGHLLAKQAIDLGWSVSTPFMDSNVKDVNEGIVKYGQLYVAKVVREQTYSGFEAQARIGVYCEQKKKEEHDSKRRTKTGGRK